MLNTRMRAVSAGRLSRGSATLPASNTASTTSALASSCCVRSIPRRSISSTEERSPAVSTRRMGTPPISIGSRKASRVVPASGVTMARSSPASRLSRLDLPTFGRPAITTLIPVASSLPCRLFASRSARSARTPLSLPAASSRWRESTSSSGKSSIASVRARSSVRRATREWTTAENSPERERSAERAASRLAASIRSATASAWARSSLPSRKARRVNSPGSARRAPASRHTPSSARMTTGPPWPCNSSTASPVYECGAGK